MGLFTQVIILLIILACMVMVLLAIRQLSHFEGFDDRDETLHLKDEVKEDGHVLSKNNIFSTLVDAVPEKETKEKRYNSNSNEPLSPNE